jgi:hypothetical protein
MSHDPFNGQGIPLGSGRPASLIRCRRSNEWCASFASADFDSHRASRDGQGDPKRIEPLVPVDLVVDHSVQVDPSCQKGASISRSGSRRKRIAVDALAGLPTRHDEWAQREPRWRTKSDELR